MVSSTGSNTSPSRFLIIFSICFVLIALVAKVIGCGGCARLLGFNGKDSLRIGAGMMTRGEVALITAQKGLGVGLLTADFFTAVILLILVSSVITPVILKKLYSGKDPEPQTASGVSGAGQTG